ncbi:unnamed protein product [Chrysoparadoxa australica]
MQYHHLHVPQVYSNAAEVNNAADSDSRAGGLTWEEPNEPAREPVPPFTAESARNKVQAAEDAWNTRDPAKVAGAYSKDTVWRNREEFFVGREAAQQFLKKKWEKELHYKLKKHLWSYQDNRISARFEYEWCDDQGQWYRTHGNEQWEFDALGYMRWRDMSANDVMIEESDKRLS